jgi:hypothetical protein
MGRSLSKEQEEKKHRKELEWILRCPMCFSSGNDLWLGGKGGLLTRKCLDCGYIDSAFIKVQGEWSPKTGESQESSDQSISS